MSFRGTKLKLKGLSGLGFGASWEVNNAEREAVRAFLTFLEDRRALFVAEWLEVPSQVESSVGEIRKESTKALTIVPEKSGASVSLRAIRAACRRFMDEPRPDFRNVQQGDRSRFFEDMPGFFSALGELRATVGIHVALLATSYDIELEPELSSILPPEDQGT